MDERRGQNTDTPMHPTTGPLGSMLSPRNQRPNSFMQNILAYLAPSIREQGAFFAAMGEALVQTMVVVPVQVAPAGGVTETRVTPAGKVSVSVSLTAGDGPLLVTVTV